MPFRLNGSTEGSLPELRPGFDLEWPVWCFLVYGTWFSSHRHPVGSLGRAHAEEGTCSIHEEASNRTTLTRDSEPMDQMDSGEGKEKPSDQSQYLTPSSKGRQRKKNSRYADYETDDTKLDDNVNVKSQKTTRRSSGGQRAAPRESPAKNRKARRSAQPAGDGEKKSSGRKTPEPADQTAVKTPKKKRGRPRKSLSNSTTEEAAVAGGDRPAGEAGEAEVANSLQPENGTPKPKRKYVRKQYVQRAESPQPENGSEGLPKETEEELGAGGRRRRGAAKAALRYLQILAKEVFSSGGEEPVRSQQPADSQEKLPKQGNVKGRRGRKRKCFNSDASEDEDFVPDTAEEEADEVEEEEEEDEKEDGESSDPDSDMVPFRKNSSAFYSSRSNAASGGLSHNGLPHVVLRTHWDSAEVTHKFRQENCSSWAFPDWIPSTDQWDPVPHSDLEEYLPRESSSAAFTVSREGLKEDAPELTLKRFEAASPHPDRWDSLLFAGGPVWALEWCPTPDGAPANQHIALACHPGMDDVHQVNRTSTEPGLVQLWDCGRLEYDSRPDAHPALAYGLALDKGFIWHLKWCPTGGWEPPDSARKAPLLPRLGLLAVATSSGVVSVYSLPHPDALLPHAEKRGEGPPIYKAQAVVTLKLGSIRAPRHQRSGQVLSLDWLPQKPHNIIAAGFYDGSVGLWDLSTKSALLRVREPDRSMTLLPFRCLQAHDHAVLALAFCPASRHLLTTAGEDRFVKTWDLRRPCDPITAQKRNLSTEICWPLNAPGLLITEDCAFATRCSLGVHYFDHHMRSYFPIIRSTTVWSISYSEWLHCVVSSDASGEVIFAIMPQMDICIPYCKRSIMRRFPVCLTSLVRREASEEESEERTGEEEEGGDTEEAPEGGGVRNHFLTPLQLQTYKEAAKKYQLHYDDTDMLNLNRLEKRVLWKRMKDTEGQAMVNVDEMPLTALYKVRFSPNMSSQVWLASAGQTGLVRLHCVRTFISSEMGKMIGESQARFSSDQRREAAEGR
ncbi:unnamed protein product [Menidia menidia]|uniref:(Atlantic silverside) hypothetical protein n=1 Tax=Menidia menidia TaxID=238744 RepID=A0A8S4BDW0_9TELE|nr:unnamed protein product [Menidia menidia]